MAAINFFDAFFADVNNKVHDLANDDLKIALTNTLPVATNTVIGNITQIANGNGYTTGGQSLDSVTSTQASGVYTLAAADEIFTASGGTMATFRWAVLYNETAASDQLIGWWDKGSTISLADGESATIDFPATVVFTMNI